MVLCLLFLVINIRIDKNCFLNFIIGNDLIRINNGGYFCFFSFFSFFVLILV